MIFNKIYKTIDRLTSKSKIIILFVLAHLVLLLMMVFTFPQINAKMGTQAFDLKSFGYTIEEATSMVQNLDQSTIDYYLFPQLFLLDILYPILLALLISALIIRLSKLIWKEKHMIANLYVLPFVAMLCDYTENILITILITNPMEISSNIVSTASAFTQMKGLFTTISWLIVIVLFVIWLKKKYSSTKVI
jgi:hypothetical protein